MKVHEMNFLPSEIDIILFVVKPKIQKIACKLVKFKYLFFFLKKCDNNYICIYNWFNFISMQIKI